MATSTTRGNSASKLQKELKFDFLKRITNDFSEDLKLGDGAFGSVYKGMFEEGGGTIAVKRLEENAPGTDDKRAFSTKIRKLMALKDDNIVQLVAFCREPQTKDKQIDGQYCTVHVIESFLCYEYLPNGNLHDYLFEEPKKIIEWDTRFKIINAICRGLQFLHNLPEKIIHLNLKPKNILLDHNMDAKIGDFVFSRLFGEQNTRITTTKKLGSVGYMSPEFLYKGEISSRSDIYSLGLMILEITTGEKNWPRANEKDASTFVNQMRINWTKERIMEVYRELEGDYLYKVDECIQIALECVDIDQYMRPSIDQIVERLNRP